jgi:hypothetical protein
VLAAAIAGDAQEMAVGRWEGSIKIPERELPLVVDLAQGESGNWVGSFIVPGLDLKGSTLTDIVVTNSSISFACKNAGGRALDVTWQGNLSKEGALTGNFLQAGNTAPFVLHKTGPPQAEPAPRSTVITKQLEGEWKGEYEFLGYPRQVTLKLANHSEGATAEFVIVGKKVNNLPVDLIEQEDNRISVDSHAAGINYEGRLNKEGTQLNGTLAQGPTELPLVLHHTP